MEIYKYIYKERHPPFMTKCDLKNLLENVTVEKHET